MLCDYLNGFRRVLLFLLLSLSLCFTFLNTSPASAQQSSYWTTTSTLVLANAAQCAGQDYDVTSTWRTALPQAINLPPAEAASMTTAFDEGSYAVSTRTASNGSGRVILVAWNPGAVTLNWNAAGGVALHTTAHHFAIITSQKAQTGTGSCQILQYSTGSATTVNTLIAGTDPGPLVYSNYRLAGTVNLNLPSGYTGIVPTVTTPVDPEPPATQEYLEVMSDVAALVLDHADMAVTAGLFLGAVNFMFQWLTATLFGNKAVKKQ